MNMNSVSVVEDRRLDRRTRTKASLLLAARRVFSERGVEDTGIAAITESAGVGVGTFYLHFKDKDELLAELLNEGLSQMRANVQAQLQRTSAERGLAALIRAIMHEAYDQKELFLIVLRGGAHGPILQARSYVVPLLTAHLDRASAEGLALPMEPDLLAHLITGMVNQAILWWLDHLNPNPDEMADRLLTLLGHGLPAQMLVD